VRDAGSDSWCLQRLIDPNASSEQGDFGEELLNVKLGLLKLQPKPLESLGFECGGIVFDKLVKQTSHKGAVGLFILDGMDRHISRTTKGKRESFIGFINR